MTKLTEDLYFRKKKTFTTGGSLPCPRAIYVCMIIIFKQLSSKPRSRPNLLWSPLGKRERKFCVKWSCSHDQDGCHAHIWQNLLQNPKSYDLETWHAALETQALQSLTLIYLQVRSDLVAYTLEWENY